MIFFKNSCCLKASIKWFMIKVASMDRYIINLIFLYIEYPFAANQV